MKPSARTRVVILTGAILLGAAPFASEAHHSAAQYDLTVRDNAVTGIVKVFTPANPHTRIVLEVTDEQGTRDIEFEGHSRNNFYRSGWREGIVKVGEKITLIAAPLRDGTDGGYVIGVITADGKRF
ncbi:MAG TPA: DUF6152 family protein [Gammaproteobacteria bacterium]